MSSHRLFYPNEANAKLKLDSWEEAELNEKIRTCLGYLKPEKIANYLDVPLERVHLVRNSTPYWRIKDLRDRAHSGVRRG